MSRPRLLLDADTRKLLARTLRNAGFDAIHVAEIGMAEADDSDILATGASQGRVVFTHNTRDYMILATRWAELAQPHAGLLVSGQA